MSVTTGNNFNEFWDFYNGMSVPAGSPKATQDAKYPPLSRAVSGLDSAAGGENPVVLCRTMHRVECARREAKTSTKQNRAQWMGV
jgi:hypothetical protein